MYVYPHVHMCNCVHTCIYVEAAGNVLFRCHVSLPQRKLLARSDRVKCMDLHPKEPWMLVSLYNGNVHVWNHESQVGEALWVWLSVSHMLFATDTC